MDFRTLLCCSAALLAACRTAPTPPAASDNRTQPVTLRFAAQVGRQPFVCGQSFADARWLAGGGAAVGPYLGAGAHHGFADAALGPARVQVGLGVEEVGVQQRREQHAQPQRLRQRLTFALSGSARQQRLHIQRRGQRQQLLRVAVAGLGRFVKFTLAAGLAAAQQTFLQVGSVVQPGMMRRNQLRQLPAGAAARRAETPLQRLQGVQGTGRRVRLVAAADAATLDMGIGILPDAALKPGP